MYLFYIASAFDNVSIGIHGALQIFPKTQIHKNTVATCKQKWQLVNQIL